MIFLIQFNEIRNRNRNKTKTNKSDRELLNKKRGREREREKQMKPDENKNKTKQNETLDNVRYICFALCKALFEVISFFLSLRINSKKKNEREKH